MAKHTIDESEKRRAACEACYLLNWAIGDLIASARLFEFIHKWEQLTPPPLQAIRVSQRMILMSLVVIVYRLKEVREQLIVEWLLSEAELQSLGFRPIDEVMGGEEKWRYFEIVRGQHAGHSFAKRATDTRPGRIVDPKVLGKALREIGLFEPEEFLKRARGLVPGVERVRDELRLRYPEAGQFLKNYGSELEQDAP